MPTPDTIIQSLSTVVALLGALVVREVLSKRREEKLKTSPPEKSTSDSSSPRLSLLYASTTGTTKRFAQQLARSLFALNVGTLRKPMFSGSPGPVDLAAYNSEFIDSEQYLIILMPTWTGGEPPASAKTFFDHLKDLANDFRVGKGHLSKTRFAIFGLGSSEYGENWAKAAGDLDEILTKLGASRILPLCCGDDSQDQESEFKEWCDQLLPTLVHETSMSRVGEGTSKNSSSSSCGACGSCGAVDSGCSSSSSTKVEGSSCTCGNQNPTEQVENDAPHSISESKGNKSWLPLKEHRRRKKAEKEAAELAAARALRSAAKNASSVSSLSGEPKVASTYDINDGADDLDIDYTEEDGINDSLLQSNVLTKVSKGKRTTARSGSESEILDVEELGAVLTRAALDKVADEKIAANEREMVTPAQRRALTKEGYRIIGSHSAVKLCRWTKAQLRGRGGCYKHTLYGITSFQCMEATPSLACANKCTFCWRHYKNPVGREWRWKTDDPGMIVDEAVSKHIKMIREFGGGTPGVIAERFEQALTVRHCALSLVGEPIMYPRVNELVRLLHKRKISTFLVTNAQFPECIDSLEPVTQLYVSIDAATRETLKEIDRPLFADFWERFLGSLDALKKKGQRTVYRMTLVKGQNMEDSDIGPYLELINRGQPDFIEIKGVTWSGVSEGSPMTMANVPWHTEVREYCLKLAARTAGSYELACEHAHSCCVLLAKVKFKNESTGQWNTHIDFDKFQDLVQRYYESDGKAIFSSDDYMLPTPSWALWGEEYNTQNGFDPADERWYRNGLKGGASSSSSTLEYKPSGSGCG
jgi:tRNA wybutosine-synthesizing protein 1